MQDSQNLVVKQTKVLETVNGYFAIEKEIGGFGYFIFADEDKNTNNPEYVFYVKGPPFLEGIFRRISYSHKLQLPNIKEGNYAIVESIFVEIGTDSYLRMLFMVTGDSLPTEHFTVITEAGNFNEFVDSIDVSVSDEYKEYQKNRKIEMRKDFRKIMDEAEPEQSIDKSQILLLVIGFCLINFIVFLFNIIALLK